MDIIGYHSELRDYLTNDVGLKQEQIRFGNTNSTVKFHREETYYALTERDESIPYEQNDAGSIALTVSPIADKPQAKMILWGEHIIFLKVLQFAGDLLLLKAQLADFLAKKQRINEAEFDLDVIWNNNNSIDLHFFIEVDYKVKFESGMDGKGGERSEC